jgi:hypothetical protein
MRVVLPLLILLVALAVSPLYAGAPVACSHCGCHEQVRKVCRLVCEIEEVKKVTYCCEAEDFCIPGPSHNCGCQEIPSCGEVRTRHKLVKKEEVKKAPKYKCVVEYLCPHCCAGRGSCTPSVTLAAPVSHAPRAPVYATP